MRLGPITDAANCLRLQDRDFLNDELQVFRARFPQVFFAVFLGALPSSPKPSEIAFWLLNHAAFQPAEAGRLNEYAALLIIDPETKCAGMTVGYGLDPHLPPAKLRALVRRLRTPLWHREYAEAIHIAIRQLDKALRRVARLTSHQREVPAPEPGSEFLRASGLANLRQVKGDVLEQSTLGDDPHRNEQAL
ncbi:MAG: TPM domain-containing protein [Roseimicrobium sp.]